MKVKKTRVVYTAVFGNYDTVSPVNDQWDCDFICFTDNPSNVAEGWHGVSVHADGETASQLNRRYKMFAHEFLADYKQSLYVDGNIVIRSDPSALFEEYLSCHTVAIPKHPARNCIYAEANECVYRGLVDEQRASQQMERYASDGFPENFGLTANYIILRNHLDPEVIKLMEAWWKEYSEACRRDQLSLMYVCWKSKFDICFMSENASNGNRYFSYAPHESKRNAAFIWGLADYVIRNEGKNYFLKLAYNVMKKAGKIGFVRRIYYNSQRLKK